jgi:hypothetical protein
MKLTNDPKSFWHGWNTQTWSTPFSGFRYGIPEYCGYQGKAIYQDDDQLWLSDPAELWDMEIPEDKIMTGKQLSDGQIRHCVSLIDCSRFAGMPPAGRRKQNGSFNGNMKLLTFPLTHVIPDAFNCYDGENMGPADIKVLHFTDMRTNPGVKLAIKRFGTQSKHWFNGDILEHRRPEIEAIFHRYYNEAIEAGYKLEDYITDEQLQIMMVDQSNYKANNGFDVSEGE